MIGTEVADLLWRQASGVLFCSKVQYLCMLDRFTVSEIWQDGLLFGAVLTDGSEIHLVWRNGMQGTRRLLRQHLGGIIEKHGHAVTRVSKGNVASQKFVARLGFERTHEDAFDIYYRIERMRHVSSTH